jgi:gamma-glutamylcyclotransferase (GGCT)/AIG2-like uncharacterized protein YtfP
MVLFVYGTLRRAAGHPMHTVLRENASLFGPARVRGVLVAVASYPGLVLDDGAGWVLGELYRLRDPTVLLPLDTYEGAAPLDPNPEYRRVRTTVLRLDGSAQAAWVYEYARPIDGLPIIASGDFLQPDRR